MHLLLSIPFFGCWSIQGCFLISVMITQSMKTESTHHHHHQVLFKKRGNKGVSIREWTCLVETKTECQSNPSPEWELCTPLCNTSAAATLSTDQPETMHSHYTCFRVWHVLIWNGAAKEWASVAALKSCRGQAKTESAAPSRAHEATWKQRMTWGPSLLKYAADEGPLILPENSDTSGYDPPSLWASSKALQPEWGEGGSHALSTSTTGTSKVFDTTTSSWSHDSSAPGAPAQWTLIDPGRSCWAAVELGTYETPELLLVPSCAASVSEPLQKSLMHKL